MSFLTINIEALTMVDMVKKDIIPACLKYQEFLVDTVLKKRQLSIGVSSAAEEDLIGKISSLTGCLYNKVSQLENSLLAAKEYEDSKSQAVFYRETIFASMQELRAVADELEGLVSKEYWPYPNYGELLFSVQ